VPGNGLFVLFIVNIPKKLHLFCLMEFDKEHVL